MGLFGRKLSISGQAWRLSFSYAKEKTGTRFQSDASVFFNRRGKVRPRGLGAPPDPPIKTASSQRGRLNNLCYMIPPISPKGFFIDLRAGYVYLVSGLCSQTLTVTLMKAEGKTHGKVRTDKYP